MPEIRYYTIRQLREVKVWANSSVDAAQVANAEFNGHDTDVAGRVTSPIREVEILVREDR